MLPFMLHAYLPLLRCCCRCCCFVGAGPIQAGAATAAPQPQCHHKFCQVQGGEAHCLHGAAGRQGLVMGGWARAGGCGSHEGWGSGGGWGWGWVGGWVATCLPCSGTPPPHHPPSAPPTHPFIPITSSAHPSIPITSPTHHPPAGPAGGAAGGAGGRRGSRRGAAAGAGPAAGGAGSRGAAGGGAGAGDRGSLWREPGAQPAAGGWVGGWNVWQGGWLAGGGWSGRSHARPAAGGVHKIRGLQRLVQRTRHSARSRGDRPETRLPPFLPGCVAAPFHAPSPPRLTPRRTALRAPPPPPPHPTPPRRLC